MIDHVSISVRDLKAAARFYEAVLGAIGYSRLRNRPATVGFGKRYPEFWLNHRPSMPAVASDSGTHICVRAPDIDAVQKFYAAALAAGGTSDGEPGPRPQYSPTYYAAFVRDPEGNRIEAVSFVNSGS
jgi:catechol 2,3-dioxygenase-like lactoylglutathione lyase family enzyme